MKKQYSSKGTVPITPRNADPRAAKQLRNHPEPKQSANPFQTNPFLRQPTKNNNLEQIDPAVGTNKTERLVNRVVETVHPGFAGQDHQSIVSSEHGGRSFESAVLVAEG